ncbi:MAG: M56 family metallopeptidase, partial [Bdellovibrio sp.]
MINGSVLDYVWKGLIAISLFSTIVLSVALLGSFVINNYVSKIKIKRFFHLHSGLLSGVLLLGVVLINMDSELASACFSRFAEQTNSLNITRLISAGYLTILTLLAVLDISKTFFAFRRLHLLQPVSDKEVTLLWRELLGKLGRKSFVPIYLQTGSGSPFVGGLLRYRLIVTEALMRDVQSEKFRAILAHEAVHIRDRDSLWLLLSHFCKRVLFFHPLVYMFYSRQ